MEKAQFYISQEQTDLTATGIDSIEFLVATNIGSELKPLVEIASGGEISRLMLALKSILAQTDPIPTLIFDEIDVGIGGHTANVVGHKLKQLSQFRQLICISHLPQIASLADKHFRINKKIIGKNTFITAKELTMEDKSITKVKVGGLIKPNSIDINESNRLEVWFYVYQGEDSLKVYYNGTRPDLFKDDAEVVVSGKFDNDLITATELQTKCASRYEGDLKNINST